MTKSKRATVSDLNKVDAHVIQPREYDEAPEWTDEQIKTAVVSRGIRLPGRPKSDITKTAVSLRLDADIVAAFRDTGAGWQTRINDTLRAKVKNGKIADKVARKRA